MQPFTSLLYFASLLSTAACDGLSDFRKLHTLVETSAADILASVAVVNASSASTSSGAPAVPSQPATTPFATAQTVQNISYAMGASQAQYQKDPVAFINGQSMGTLDRAYFTMVNEFLSLSQALVARGRALHDELNQPVALAIDGLARGVHAYGLGLTRDDIVNDHSTIRTITVENALVDAGAAWTYSITYPAQKAKRSFVV